MQQVAFASAAAFDAAAKTFYRSPARAFRFFSVETNRTEQNLFKFLSFFFFWFLCKGFFWSTCFSIARHASSPREAEDEGCFLARSRFLMHATSDYFSCVFPFLSPFCPPPSLTPFPSLNLSPLRVFLPHPLFLTLPLSLLLLPLLPPSLSLSWAVSSERGAGGRSGDGAFSGTGANSKQKTQKNPKKSEIVPNHGVRGEKKKVACFKN